MSKITDSVWKLAEPVAADLGLEIWDIEFVREAGTYDVTALCLCLLPLSPGPLGRTQGWLLCALPCPDRPSARIGVRGASSPGPMCLHTLVLLCLTLPDTHHPALTRCPNFSPSPSHAAPHMAPWAHPEAPGRTPLP